MREFHNVKSPKGEIYEFSTEQLRDAWRRGVVRSNWQIEVISFNAEYGQREWKEAKECILMLEPVKNAKPKVIPAVRYVAVEKPIAICLGILSWLGIMIVLVGLLGGVFLGQPMLIYWGLSVGLLIGLTWCIIFVMRILVERLNILLGEVEDQKP